MAQVPAPPLDATLSVTRAARVLGVHPNTVRAWSDQGRLRYYRINERGDRRYRVSDLQRFLASAERLPLAAPGGVAPPRLAPTPHRRPARVLPRRRLRPDRPTAAALIADLATLATTPEPRDLAGRLAAACDRLRRAWDALDVAVTPAPPTSGMPRIEAPTTETTRPPEGAGTDATGTAPTGTAPTGTAPTATAAPRPASVRPTRARSRGARTVPIDGDPAGIVGPLGRPWGELSVRPGPAGPPSDDELLAAARTLGVIVAATLGAGGMNGTSGPAIGD